MGFGRAHAIMSGMSLDGNKPLNSGAVHTRRGFDAHGRSTASYQMRTDG
jgi:hypothetical protein